MSFDKRLIILSTLILIGLPMAAAQAQTEEVGPGMIGPESALYGLETAWDNTAVSMGLKAPGSVAQERAAEVNQSVERGRPEAAARAARNMQRIANRSRSEEDEEKVQEAMNSLQQSMNRLQQRMQEAPNEQARQGMQTALGNMQGALNNTREAQQRRGEARNQSIGSPGVEDGVEEGLDNNESNESLPAETGGGGSPDSTNGTITEGGNDTSTQDSGSNMDEGAAPGL